MNGAFVFLLLASVALIDCLIGGTRLLFSLPAYGVLSAAGVLSLAFRPKTAANPACLLSTLLFSGYLLARAWFSPINYLARPDFFALLGALSVYLLTAFYIPGAKHRLLLIGGLLLLAALELFPGLLQFARGNEFMLFGFLRPAMDRRASGMFISPNHFAGFMETAGVLGLGATVWSRWPSWAKMLAGYLSLGCYVGVAISGSRGGYLSTLFSLLIFTVLSLRFIGRGERRDFRRAAVIAGLGLVLFLGCATALMTRSPLLQNRLSHLFAKEVRLYTWGAALSQFRVAPVFGTGAGTHLIYGRLFRRPQLQTDPVHAHGDYLELLAEYGLAGEALLVFFLWAHIANGLRSARRLPALLAGRGVFSNQIAVLFGALGAVAACLIHSIFDFNLHIPGNALLLAVVFGILANPEAESAGWSWPRLALPLLGAAIAILGLPALPGERFAEQARTALRDAKYERSIALAKKGMEHEKEDPWLPFYIGEANRALGSAAKNEMARFLFFDSAAEAYRDALKLFPEDEQILVGLARALNGIEEYDEAGKAYRAAAGWDPNLIAIHIFYAQGLRAAGRSAEAAEQYREARALENPPPYIEPRPPGPL